MTFKMQLLNILWALYFLLVVVPVQILKMFYNATFPLIGFPRTNIKNAAAIGDIFDVLLIFVVGAALIATVANSSTGSAAKNANVTASPGAADLTRLMPLLFVAVIIFAGFDVLKRRSSSI